MNIIEREKATYSFDALDRLVRREWGLFGETQTNWKKQGWDGRDMQFLYDEYPYAEDIVDLVGIYIPIVPAFKEELLETKDGYTYFRTVSGGIEKFINDMIRGDEIMPQYVRHAVESDSDWYDAVKPKLDPDTPQRWVNFREKCCKAASQTEKGEKLFSARSIGGYMYLRAMMGPENTLLAFYDRPQIVHDMMKTWLHLVKTCLSRIQKEVPFFKFFMGEDICYKNGMLISPAMAEEFLFPYYRDLLDSLKNGQQQPMHIEVDTDGNLEQALPLYRKAGFNAFMPFEAAAGNDVVKLAGQYPDVVMSGGFDKRILADSKDAIRNEIERIIPFMTERGGYIPTCDHTVPSNVPYENYLYYRELITELDKRKI
jgi:hypothetical protein